jgi:hypothetical protein
MDKREFVRRLGRAGERAWELARQYILEELPPRLLYILPEYDDPRGRRGPAGTLKYFGGRFVAPQDLTLVSAQRAADLLWVDGKVPAWVNVGVCATNSEATHIQLWCSKTLIVADEATLPRDITVDEADLVEPFRIRGPAVPDSWRSVELDGRVSIELSDGAVEQGDEADEAR